LTQPPIFRLQNGRFDTADRLFNSVAGAWASVTSTAPDVKELIPEFYLRSPGFLTNRLQLALGTRQVLLCNHARLLDECVAGSNLHKPGCWHRWAACDTARTHRCLEQAAQCLGGLQMHHWHTPGIVQGSCVRVC
jgi:Beige/BEACH domain